MRGRYVAALLALVLVAAAACSDDEGGGDPEGLHPSTTAMPTSGGPEPDAEFNQAQFEGEPTEGGSITIGVWGRPGRLEPTGSLSEAAQIGPALAVYDPLIARDAEGGFVPSLATDWSASDDLTTYTLTLREGVVFHDGAPFDSAAVVTHFAYLKDPDAQCVCAQQVATIASVDAPDPTTVVFHLTAPDTAFLSFLAGPNAFVVSPKAIAAAHLEYGTDYGPGPVGTGPFSLAGTDPVVLEKNPRYWATDEEGRALPYLDRIEVRTIDDEDERLAALRSGDVDLIQTTDNATVLTAEEEGLDVQKAVGASARVLVFNTRVAPFDDVRARRAVAQGIDRERIDQVAYDGTHLEAWSLFPHRSRLGAGVTWPAFDAGEAKRMVGRLDMGTVTASCTDADEQHRVMEELKRQASAIGLSVETEYADGGAFVNQILGSRDFRAACFNGPYGLDADSLYSLFHSDGDTNVTGYSDPDVDADLEAIRATGDDVEQRRLVAKVLEKLADDVPVVPLVYELNANIHGDDVSGLPAPEVGWLGAIRFTTLYRTG
jgi:peptide/nickel transport system substrate-binding protein